MYRPTRHAILAFLVALAASQGAATRDVEYGSFDVPSDYKVIKPNIPKECRPQRYINVYRRSKCQPLSRGFSACGVFDTRRTKCSTFCYTTVLSRALQARTCRNRPSMLNAWLMYRYCLTQCYRANNVLRNVLYRKKVPVKAILYVSYAKRRYSAKYIVFRLTRRVLKDYLPALCIPNPRCKKSRKLRGKRCKKTLCRGALAAKPQPYQNCWYCAWIGAHCHSSCSRFAVFRWVFRWKY